MAKLLNLTVVLIASLVFTCFLLFNLSSLLMTIPILILSTTFIYRLTKTKRVLVENTSSETNRVFEAKSETSLETEVGSKSEVFDFPSDSESSSESMMSDSIELDWLCSDELSQNLYVSEDEDGLIEIALLGRERHGTCGEVKLKEENLLSNSAFRQEDLMELLAEMSEMNEEENLIEIDICMGSIKSSRLEIEA